jgi:hypothetical protein
MRDKNKNKNKNKDKDKNKVTTMVTAVVLARTCPTVTMTDDG